MNKPMKNQTAEEIVFNPKSAWTHPDSYYGRTWEGWHYVIGKHRDSGCLDQSNYAFVQEKLSAWLNVEGSGVEENLCRHWAVGHTEEIMISRDAPMEAVEIVADILRRLHDYPVLDESHYTDLQTECADSTWENMSENERLEILTKYGFENTEEKAKQNYMPQGDDNGYLWEYLTADCG